MKKFIISKIWYIIGGLVGALAGYLYWRYVGCASGTCMITSRPINSTLYGMVMGSLLFSMLERKEISTKNK
ncbi:MAG: hypothetical protein K1X55_00460 [Chitinophagales bacterium]|nr:hypothetical protein [Chitinophagales bacterium]